MKLRLLWRTQVLAVTLWLIGYIMYITPVAVFSLICKAIAENSQDTLLDTLTSIGVLLGVTVAGFALHILVCSDWSNAHFFG